MAEPHVLTALRAKRGELAGMIDALQDQLCERMIEIDHVDCTLRIFDPDIDLDEIKPKPLLPRHHAFKGQVTRAILAMLRTDGPLDGKEIARRLMVERELNMSDKALCNTMGKRIGAALRSSRDRGLVTSRAQKAGFLLWEIVG